MPIMTKNIKSAKFSSKRNVGKEAVRKINPFEIRINNSKHKVLGQKLKSEQGLPGVSRHKGIQKRTKTLLQEYKWKNKSNEFIDQRIGETNSSMTEEDKMMARFAAARRRAFNKKEKFNLSDSDVLFHRGQSLNEIEKFEDPRSDDEDEDDPGKSGALKGKFVQDAHFGGGTLSMGKQDRESLIEQLINESKKRRAEQKRTKEETFEDTEQLDDDWKSLGLVVTENSMKKDDSTTKSTRLKDYDVMVRQLKFEPHAQATDRIKSEEEIAKENKERLEKLEKERLKQLREMEVKHGTHRSADDLDDGFQYSTEDLEDTDFKSGNTDDVLSESSNEEGDDEDDSDDDDEDDNDDGDSDNNAKNNELTEQKSVKVLSDKHTRGKSMLCSEDKESADEEEDDSEFDNEGDDADDGEQETKDKDESTAETSDDEECALDDLSDLKPNAEPSPKIVPQNKELSINTDTEKTKNYNKTKTLEPIDLPFIINVPESYEEFKNLIKDQPVKQLETIFDRIFKTSHPSLELKNKKKMYSLAEYVIQFVNDGEAKLDVLFVLVNTLGFLKEFNGEEILNKMIQILSSKLDEDNTPDHNSKNYQLTSDISFLLLYLMTYLNELETEALLPVNKAALGIASKYLSEIEPCCGQNAPLTAGIYISAILLLDSSRTSKVYPEAITFLNKCIKTSTSIGTTNKNEDDSKLFKQINENIFSRFPKLFEGYFETYMKNPQTKLLVAPLRDTILQLKASECDPVSAAVIHNLNSIIEKHQNTQIPPVIKAAKKPKALRQYEPSFNIVTVAGKWNKGLPVEKVEEQKLLHKLKNEKKGAMRELRRDRAFLADIKLTEQALSDEVRKRKVKEIYGSAAAQQGELRSLKRKK